MSSSCFQGPKDIRRESKNRGPDMKKKTIMQVRIGDEENINHALTVCKKMMCIPLKKLCVVLENK
jgi:hypothetical protein